MGQVFDPEKEGREMRGPVSEDPSMQKKLKEFAVIPVEEIPTGPGWVILDSDEIDRRPL